MITIWTQAYNTEKYIRECIESVLNQSYTDFEYILVDNGSTDGTGEIIEEYAAQDNRIRVFRETNNYRGMRYHRFLDNMRGDYFVALDSDDWLEPDFLMKLHSFCERERLDMAVSGSCYYLEDEKKRGILRKPPERLSFTHEEIPQYFSAIHAFLRTTWGKMIRTEILKSTDLTLFRVFVNMQSNGSDTAFSVSVLENCERVGMLNECLHHYRIRKDSVFREYHSKRYDAYEQLYDQTIQVLSKFGPLSPVNRRFTSLVFYNSIQDAFDVCINSRLADSDKVIEMTSILGKPKVLEARKVDIENDGWNILKPYLDWLMSKKDDVPFTWDMLKKLLIFAQPVLFDRLSEEEWGFLLEDFQISLDILKGNYHAAYESFSKLAQANQTFRISSVENYCLTKIEGSDAQRLHYYLDIGRKYPVQQTVLLGLTAQILQKNSLFTTFDFNEILFTMPEVVEAISLGDYDRAIDNSSGLLQNPDFECRLSLAKLMKLVSAVDDDAPAYVYFSKVYAWELLSAELWDEAEESIKELFEMIPQDPDVQELIEYTLTAQEKR